MHSYNQNTVTGANFAKTLSIIVNNGRDQKSKKASLYITQRLDVRNKFVNSDYCLEIPPRWRRRGLGISGADVASRYLGEISLNYKLFDSSTNKVIESNRFTVESTFGAARDSYGVISSTDASLRNLSDLAADRMIAEIAIFFQGL